MVSDRDIAAKIREAAPGNTLADVLAAWDLVRARLDSRDDSDTARAFREVLDRYRATPPSDRAAANPDDPQIYAKAEWIFRHLDLAKDSATQLLWLRNELTMVIAAARAPLEAKVEALEDELKKWHEIGRRAKRNLDAPFTAENPVQILVDAAALAALVNPPKAEEVEK